MPMQIPHTTSAEMTAQVATIMAAIAGKADAGHVHAWAEISNKPTIPVIVQQAHIADAPTDLNVVTTALGSLTGELNNTNGKLNKVFDVLEVNGMLAAA